MSSELFKVTSLVMDKEPQVVLHFYIKKEQKPVFFNFVAVVDWLQCLSTMQLIMQGPSLFLQAREVNATEL